MKKFKGTITFILLFAILLAAYLFYVRPNLYSILGQEVEFDSLYVSERVSTDKDEISVVKNNVFTANLEGLKMLDYKKEGAWSKAYHFNDLLFMTDGEYISTVDITGKEAYIFKYNRKLSADIKTEGDIVYADMNKNGHLGLISDLGTTQLISIYDNEGQKKAERVTNFKESGYPVFLSLSNENTKVVASHLNMKNNKIESVVTFFDFSDEGKTLEDRILGHKTFSDTVISRGFFLDNEHIVLVGDDAMFFYSFDKTIEQMKTVEFESDEVDIVLYKDEVLIEYVPVNLQNSNDKKSYIISYDKNGEMKWNFYAEEDIKIAADEKYFYLIDGNSFSAYKKDKSLWSSKLSKNIKDIKFIDEGTYLVVYDRNFEILKIRNL